MSREWRICNGVRQGGILSPIFFKLYINDLIDRISKCELGCKLGMFSSNIVAYADDIVLLAPSLNALQCLADLILEEISKISLKFNSSKSLCMKFCAKKLNISNVIQPKIRLGANYLNFVTHIKYLGFIITNNLSNKDDIIRKKNKFYSSFNSILRKFYYVYIDIFLIFIQDILLTVLR